MANYLNTRIKLRYDELENWKSNNPTLLDGELAIVAIPTNSKDLQTEGTTPPQILFKVGPGAFNSLPYASGKAADVYAWAKQEGLSINKDGSGNVVSGIEWDSEANNGKGGIKFTTAAVATSEGLENVQGRLAKLEAEVGDAENDYANSRIDALEKTISDNQANWAKDDDTTYTFEEIKNTDERVTGIKITPEGGSTQSIRFDFLTLENLESYLNPEDDVLYLGSVYAEHLATESGSLEFAKDDVHIQELVADYENKAFKIVQGTTEKTIATVDQIPGIKVNNAGHADSADSATNASKLGGQEPSYYATAGYIESMVGGLTSGAFQVGAAVDADKLGGQEPSYYAVDSLVVHSSEKGNANGVATLGADGKVPTSQLPSYVDDVLTYASKSGFPTSGETGKIYVAEDTNITYRWSGTQYVEISASLALGETSSTAYSGDKGKANADAIADIQGKYQPKILVSPIITIEGEHDDQQYTSTTVEDALSRINQGVNYSYQEIANLTSTINDFLTSDGIACDSLTSQHVALSDVGIFDPASDHSLVASLYQASEYDDVSHKLAEASKVTVNGNGILKAVELVENGTSLANKYLSLSGGRMTGNIDLNSSKLQGTYQGTTRNIAYMDSMEGLHLGEGALGATIHSHSAPKWKNQQNVTKTLATTDEVVKLTGDQNVKGTKTFEKVVLENAEKTNSITIRPTVDGNEFYTPGIRIQGLTYEDTGAETTLELDTHGVSFQDENHNNLVSIGFSEATPDQNHFSGSVYIKDVTSGDCIEFFGSEIQISRGDDYESVHYPSRGGTLAVKEDIPTNAIQYDQKETPDAWFSDANVLIINCGSSKFQN